MGITEALYSFECPRCGRLSCEQNGIELFCPNCLYHEIDHSNFQIGDHASVAPSDAAISDLWSECKTATLGESIEQVPSDPWRWKLSLNDERKLRMTEEVQNERQNSLPVKEAAPYELIAYPDDFRGTSWIKHGVAWPTKDGRRLKIKIFMDKPLPENGKLLLVESLRAAARTRTEESPF